MLRKRPADATPAKADDLFYGKKLLLREIAAMWGVSVQRVSALKKRARNPGKPHGRPRKVF